MKVGLIGKGFKCSVGSIRNVFWKMIQVIFGKESFLVQREYLELKEKFQKENPDGSLLVFSADEIEKKQFCENISQTQGLFSSNKLIILRDFFSLADSRQEFLIAEVDFEYISKSKELQIVFAEMAGKIPNGKIFRKIKKIAKVDEKKLLNNIKLGEWVAEETEKRSRGKVKFASGAVEFLVMMSKGNMWKLNGEIDVLVNFKNEGAINQADIELLCRGEAESKIFDLIDAIGEGNRDLAIRTKTKLINQGENEFMIFSMILGQMRNMIKVLQCQRKGIKSEQEISDETGVHPFVVKKTIRQVQNFSYAKLAKLFDEASKIDVGAKNGELLMNDALDVFIAKT